MKSSLDLEATAFFFFFAQNSIGGVAEKLFVGLRKLPIDGWRNIERKAILEVQRVVFIYFCG